MDKEEVMISYLRFPLEWIANSETVGMQLMRGDRYRVLVDRRAQIRSL
jgi:hypothetical protein